MSLVMLSKIPLVKQINVCCNIHLNFDSGFTYSSSTECLICGFNKNLVAIKTFVERHVLRWNKEREKVWFSFTNVFKTFLVPAFSESRCGPGYVNSIIIFTTGHVFWIFSWI